MMLSELLPNSKLQTDVLISGISDDSRAVIPGDLFCALPGERFNGRDFIMDAVERGAVAIACEPPSVDADVPVVELANLKACLGELAGQINGDPSQDVSVVAVTGTNGKTSFADLLAQALNSAGLRTGIIGTMGYGMPGMLQDPGMTTPGAIDLQAKVKQLVDDECLAIVLEASSHGLAQQRLNGIALDTAVLTNLTHDHLDYHGSLDEYKRAKQRLFEFTGLRNAVLNLDDQFGRELSFSLGKKITLTSYSKSDAGASVFCHSIEYQLEGLVLRLVIDSKEIEINLPLLGEFNVENALAVAATLRAMNHDTGVIRDAMNLLKPVMGRMDCVSQEGKPTVIVDFAHTPDALAKALKGVRQHLPGRRVHCIFGCGGDRDRSKRAIMGELADNLADQVILTSDNPRSEDPEQIIDEIAAGMSGKPLKFVDRRAAILQTILEADTSDVILVAGKGHENYQVLATGSVPFSDFEVITSGLDAWLPSKGLCNGE